MSKYINKPIVGRTGYTNECWLAASGSFDVKNNTANLNFWGWMDLYAQQSKLAIADTTQTTIRLDQLTTFLSLLQELLGAIVGEGGCLAGGIMDAEGSITCDKTSPTGHTVTYWREATGKFSLMNGPMIEANSGFITLRGWKDKATYEAKGTSEMTVEQMVSSIVSLASFEAAWAEIAELLISQAGGFIFQDGTIEDLLPAE